MSYTEPTDSLVFFQPAPKDPERIIKVIRDELKTEEHFESVINQTSFRAELLRKVISKIEKL